MCILGASFSYSLAQRPICNAMDIQGVIMKDFETKDKSILKEGTPVVLQFITKLRLFDYGDEAYQAILLANNKQFYMPLNKLKSHFRAEQMTKEQFWQFTLSDKAKHFSQESEYKDIQREQILEAKNYIAELEKANLFYNDAAIEDYLQCLLLGITPSTHLFNREIAQPTVRIIMSSNPDMMMLSNNTLLISTGMLTILDSEEELIALLSREVSHYLLDHALITVKKNIARARRAEFWGAVAEGVIAATEETMYERHDYYNPILFFDAYQALDALVNRKIAQRMGMDYLEEQEEEADLCAVRYMKNEDRNPNALYSALHKIKTHYENDKSSIALEKFEPYGTLLKRIKKIEVPQSMPEDRKYLKTMMGVVSYEAIMYDYKKDYKNSFRLAMKNIHHSLGISDDYLIVARSMMKQANTPESNSECMLYLDKADMLSESENVNITKMRILLLLRDNKQTEAVEQLKKYQSLLDILFQQPHTEADAQWIAEEHSWAKNLLERLFIT